jgi:hypothetical protein
MKRFLEKLRLIEYLTTELEIQKSDFLKNFKHHVDEGDIGYFSGAFDAFSSSKNEYKGHVGNENFKIRRRRKFFDTNMNLATAKGIYRQKGNNLIIETEINGFSGMMIPMYIFLIIFYSIFIFGFFMADNIEGGDQVFVGPFIFIHALFMFGIPYFIMRRSVHRLKHELEREFYYMTKD